jgi:hypothetical protein
MSLSCSRAVSVFFLLLSLFPIASTYWNMLYVCNHKKLRVDGFQQLFCCSMHVCCGHCIATDMFSELFPSNSCHFWLSARTTIFWPFSSCFNGLIGKCLAGICGMWIYRPGYDLLNWSIFFLIIPVYLQSVQVHSVNWLKEVYECLGEGRSALFYS